jgi:hypothetical protein
MATMTTMTTTTTTTVTTLETMATMTTMTTTTTTFVEDVTALVEKLASVEPSIHGMISTNDRSNAYAKGVVTVGTALMDELAFVEPSTYAKISTKDRFSTKSKKCKSAAKKIAGRQRYRENKRTKKAMGITQDSIKEPDTIITHRQPMYLDSVHTFKDKKSGSSQCTRHIKSSAIVAIEKHYTKGTKKAMHNPNQRVHKKDIKIEALPTPGMRSSTALEMSGILATPNTNVYIAGWSIVEIPPLPMYSTSWDVKERFEIFHNNNGSGCQVAGAFTLLPREWIKKIFHTTLPFFNSFKNILSKHTQTHPRGKTKIPIYEPGTRKTYFTCGMAPDRGGTWPWLLH